MYKFHMNSFFLLLIVKYLKYAIIVLSEIDLFEGSKQHMTIKADKKSSLLLCYFIISLYSLLLCPTLKTRMRFIHEHY